MLGAVAGAIIRLIQIISHTTDKRRRANSFKLVARQARRYRSVVECCAQALARLFSQDSSPSRSEYHLMFTSLWVFATATSCGDGSP